MSLIAEAGSTSFFTWRNCVGALMLLAAVMVDMCPSARVDSIDSEALLHRKAFPQLCLPRIRIRLTWSLEHPRECRSVGRWCRSIPKVRYTRCARTDRSRFEPAATDSEDR